MSLSGKSRCNLIWVCVALLFMENHSVFLYIFWAVYIFQYNLDRQEALACEWYVSIVEKKIWIKPSLWKFQLKPICFQEVAKMNMDTGHPYFLTCTVLFES